MAEGIASKLAPELTALDNSDTISKLVVVFDGEEVTRNTVRAHGLPPDPDRVCRFNSTSLQALIMDGPDKTTAGADMVAGADTLTFMWADVGHALQTDKETVEGH